MRRHLPLLAAGSLIAGLFIVWAVKTTARRDTTATAPVPEALRPPLRPQGIPHPIRIEITLIAANDEATPRSLAQGNLADSAAWEKLTAMADAGQAERLVSCLLECPDGTTVTHAEAVSEVPVLVGGQLDFPSGQVVDQEFETRELGHRITLAARWTGSHVRVEVRLESMKWAGDSRVEYFDAHDPLSGKTIEFPAPRFHFNDVDAGADVPPGEPMLMAVTQDAGVAEASSPQRTRYLFLKAEPPAWPHANGPGPAPRAGWRVDQLVIELPTASAVERLLSRSGAQADHEWLQAALSDAEATLVSVQRVSLTAEGAMDRNGDLDQAEIRSQLSTSTAANWNSAEGAPLEMWNHSKTLAIEAPRRTPTHGVQGRVHWGMDLPGRSRDWRIFADHPAPVIRTESSRVSGFNAEVSLPADGVRLVSAAPTPSHFEFGKGPPTMRLVFLRSEFHGGADGPSEPFQRDEDVQFAVLSLPADLGLALFDDTNDPVRAAGQAWDSLDEGTGRLSVFAAQAGGGTLRTGIVNVWPCLDDTGPMSPQRSGFMTRLLGLHCVFDVDQPEEKSPFAGGTSSVGAAARTIEIDCSLAPDRHPDVADLFAAISDDSDPFFPEHFDFTTDAVPLAAPAGEWAMVSLKPAEVPMDSPDHGRWVAVVARRLAGPR